MIVQYFQFLPVFKSHHLLYKIFIIIIIVLIYSTALLLAVMAFRIKYRKIKRLWFVDILKITPMDAMNLLYKLKEENKK